MGVFKRIFSGFQGHLKVFQMEFKRSVKGVSRKFFNGVLSGFQECLKEVESVFEGSFQGVSRIFKEVLRVFQESFKDDSREHLGSFKSRMFCQYSSTCISECGTSS